MALLHQHAIGCCATDFLRSTRPQMRSRSVASSAKCRHEGKLGFAVCRSGDPPQHAGSMPNDGFVCQASSAATPAVDTAQEPSAAGPPPYVTHSWTWRGHKINYATAGCGKPILFVHGFGASVGHWRKNMSQLSSQYKVWAIDLLGQGASDKPATDYSMELWAELLQDFISEFIQDERLVLVGNSVGSLACLMVNAAEPAGRIAGTILVNCAGGLNNKAITDDWRIKLALPIFWLIDWLLSKPRVARYLFDRFRSKENLRKVLLNVYRNPEAVDDQLVDMLFQPSCDEGALETFVSIITGPPGPSPIRLMPSIRGPLLVLWGDSDVFTPVDGPVGRFFQALPASRPDTEFVLFEGGNHCLHDDDPDIVNEAILVWLQQKLQTQGAQT